MQLQEIKVQFDTKEGKSKLYSYSAPYEMGVEVGDVVVVDSPHSGFTCVTVYEIGEEALNSSLRVIVDKVDVAAHEQRQALNREAFLLKAEMKKRHKEILQNQLHEKLAGEDKVYSQLFKRLQKLGL